MSDESEAALSEFVTSTGERDGARAEVIARIT